MTAPAGAMPRGFSARCGASRWRGKTWVAITRWTSWPGRSCCAPGIDPASGAVVLTSRVSTEMVQKSVTMGAATSLPSRQRPIMPFGWRPGRSDADRPRRGTAVARFFPPRTACKLRREGPAASAWSRVQQSVENVVKRDPRIALRPSHNIRSLVACCWRLRAATGRT